MTGIDDGQQAQAAMRLGAQDWLTKGQPEPGTVLRALRYSVERKRLANDLMRSQQLEAVGRLAGNVAHEFNNVLMTIIGNSERAAVTEDRDVRDQAIRQIQQAATHGALLTRQLLGMSRPRTISAVTSADVNQAITNVMGLCQAVLPRSFRIRVTKTDVVRVGLPQEQLEQVLLNLLLNARDAMPEGGVISVTVAPMLSDRQEAALKHHSTGSDRYGVRVDVSDTGTGIHADAIRHLFEPFFTTKGTVGTGLGLAISKELVEQAGGTIRVLSAAGEGTSVILDLPAVPTRAEGR
jgi:signal transduction histidine kinase